MLRWISWQSCSIALLTLLCIFMAIETFLDSGYSLLASVTMTVALMTMALFTIRVRTGSWL